MSVSKANALFVRCLRNGRIFELKTQNGSNRSRQKTRTRIPMNQVPAVRCGLRTDSGFSPSSMNTHTNTHTTYSPLSFRCNRCNRLLCPNKKRRRLKHSTVDERQRADGTGSDSVMKATVVMFTRVIQHDDHENPSGTYSEEGHDPSSKF